MVNGSEGKHQRNCLSCRIWTAASCPIRFIWQSRIPAIYQTLLDRYGLKAEECVFLDDTVRNVEAAQALGIAGIVVTSQEQAKKELETLL